MNVHQTKDQTTQPITTQKNQPLYGGRKPHIVKFVKKVQKSKSPKVPVVKPKRYDTCTRSQWLRKGWRMPPDVMTNHPASSKHATFCQGSDMLCASSTWGVTFRGQVFFPKYSRLSKLLTRGNGKLTDRKTDIGERPGSSAYQAAYRSSTSGFSNTSVETAMNCIRMMRFRAHNNTRTCHISGLWRARSAEVSRENCKSSQAKNCKSQYKSQQMLTRSYWLRKRTS